VAARASGRKWPQVAASGRKWPQVAASGRKAASLASFTATCSHLQPLHLQPLEWLQVAASGRKNRKWPQVAAPSEWPQVAAFGDFNFHTQSNLPGRFPIAMFD